MDRQCTKNLKYADFESYFQFLDIICNYDLNNGAVIVSENIREMKGWKPGNSLIVEQTDNYERGFANEKPYFWDKQKNRYLTSEMGKEFSLDKRKFVAIPDANFTTGLPYIMKVFDIAYGKKVVLIDATFNKIIYDNHLFRYANSIIQDEESLGLKENHIQIPRLQNKNTIIYKVIPPGKSHVNYSKYTLEHGGFELIEKQLKKILPYLKDNGHTYAGIMHLKYEKILSPIGKKLKKHYFSQRGMNEFKDLEYLIIIGTPFVPPYAILFSHVLEFGQAPKDSTPIINNGFKGYNDELLQQLLQVRVYDEQYQAAHRCRPLLNDRRIIFYGRVPDKLKEEFTYKEVTFQQLFAEIQGYKEYYLEHPDEVLQLISKWPHINNYNYLAKEMQDYWGLPSTDVKEIIDNAFETVNKKIINLLRKSRYNSMYITKLHNNSNYGRNIVEIALELLIRDGTIEIEGRSHNKRLIRLISEIIKI